MKNKKDHHYTMLIGVFVLVVLAAAIIFMTQFNAQVGEAGRMLRTNTLNTDIIQGKTQIKTDVIIGGGKFQKPTISTGDWEAAAKKGLLIDPGYGLPDFEGMDDIIIINTGEYEPKMVLYDPRWHEDISKMFKKKEPTKPLPPTLEELGRISKSGSWTCYYDENGNFVRAWRMSRDGRNVEINEDPDGSHKCPKTKEVKKITPPTEPSPIISEPVISQPPTINEPTIPDDGVVPIYYD